MNAHKPLTLDERRAIVKADLPEVDIGKDDNYKVQKSNIDMTVGVYQGNLMVGSSSWLLWYGRDLETHEGWHVLEARLPVKYFGPGARAYHAYKAGWTTEQINFHMYDHNCAESLSEVSAAIYYWNSEDSSGGAPAGAS